MCIAKNFASRQKPVFTDAEANNVNYVKESTAYVYSKSLFESSRTDWGGIVCKYGTVVQGLLQFKGFHLLSFDHHFPPIFVLVLLLLVFFVARVGVWEVT